MKSLEELKAKREEEALKYKKTSKGLELKRQKANVKQDIRNIRAANLRGKFGFVKLKPVNPKVVKGTGTFLKTMGKIGLGLLDGAKMLNKDAKKQNPFEQSVPRQGYNPNPFGGPDIKPKKKSRKKQKSKKKGRKKQKSKKKGRKFNS